jgi:soluble lytic murein transglycosylase-like protein
MLTQARTKTVKFGTQGPPGWKSRVWLLAAVLLCFAASAQAEIYRYVDSKGKSVFTDRPLLGSQYTLVWRSSKGAVGKYASRSSKKRYKRSGKAPNWRNKKHYESMIRKTAKQHRVSPELLHAVVQAESAYDPKAKSHAGAMGLMQLMPATAERYGVSNAWDPAQNLAGGARYLRDLLDMFNNNLRLALAAYNAGEGAVKKYGNRIPPYPETRDYVSKVIDFYLNEREQRRS